MTARTRVAILVGIVVLAVLGAGGYLLATRHAQDRARADAPAVATQDLAGVLAKPHLIFRSTALAANYGHVAAVPLSNPDGPRAFTPAQCDRVYARSGEALCLAADRGVVTTYRAQILGPNWTTIQTLPLTGLPSRARISPDGKLTSTTTFVFGDSYSNPGQFSTRTIISTAADAKTVADVEAFSLLVDGKPNTARDRNIWGVTFAADDDRFYATAASGGKTWLVRGSIAARTLTAIRTDVECPSLSPDGTRIAFKKHGDLPAGQWHLAVYDLASSRETVLAETRSVDDQAEWLDNTHVVYGLPRTVSGTASSDIWMVPADGTGAASILVHDAWSPAVVG